MVTRIDSDFEETESELIQEARSLFGNGVVDEVLALVEVSDPDGVY
jgi:hypothetical protein